MQGYTKYRSARAAKPPALLQPFYQKGKYIAAAGKIVLRILDPLPSNNLLTAVSYTHLEPTPPSSGQGYTSMGFIIAGCLLGGLFLLIRHRQHA